MSGLVRRVAALAAMLPLVAIAVLGVTPDARAGIVVGSASVTITKVTDPAIDAQDFVFSINGSPFFITLDTDPTSLSVPSSFTSLLDAEDFGAFTITEGGGVGGWTLTDIQCTGDSDASYNVEAQNVVLDVDDGEIINCIFYNSKFSQLTVQKVTSPIGDPQDFDFDLTGGGVPAGVTLDTDPDSPFNGSNTTYPLPPDDLGVHTITESLVPGWLLTDLECTGAADSSTNVGTRTATVDIGAGELVTCTFTNMKLPLLTLTKVTVPASDPQDFYLEIPGDVNTTLDTDPASTDVPNSETFSFGGALLGERNILETAVAGWTLTDITCTEGSEISQDLASGSVTIQLGADSVIECVFTNTKDTEPTEAPPTDEPTIKPTGDSGGATDAATEPGTSTEGSKAQGDSTVGMGLALITLILLSGTVILTRPKRSRT